MTPIGPGETSPVTRGDGMLHPVALVAVVVLVLNDHVWKGVGPGWITGKLSDVAGLVFFPLLLQALVEVAGASRRLAFVPSRRMLAIAVTGTGMAFAAANLLPLAADAYRYGLGLFAWPLRPGAPFGPVQWVADPTDLLALPALLIAWRIGTRRADVHLDCLRSEVDHAAPPGDATEEPVRAGADRGRAVRLPLDTGRPG